MPQHHAISLKLSNRLVCITFVIVLCHFNYLIVTLYFNFSLSSDFFILHDSGFSAVIVESGSAASKELHHHEAEMV